MHWDYKLYRFLVSLFASISMPFSWDSYYLYLILLFGCTKKSIGINVIIAIIIHILVQVKVVRRITVERLYFPKKYSFSNVVPLPFHCRYLQCECSRINIIRKEKCDWTQKKVAKICQVWPCFTSLHTSSIQ